jgi:hypothetical protein
MITLILLCQPIPGPTIRSVLHTWHHTGRTPCGMRAPPAEPSSPSPLSPPVFPRISCTLPLLLPFPAQIACRLHEDLRLSGLVPYDFGPALSD